MGDNKAKPSKGKASQASKGKAAAADDDDFDSICDAFAAVNSKCNVKGCRGGSVILLQTCPLCRSVYCLGHRLPEVHGCGGAAKTQAKRDAQKPKKGTTLGAKQDRERAEKAFKTKLKEKENQRKGKKSKDS